MNIIKHYYKLIYFALNRFKGNNYFAMRKYFADILIYDISPYIDLKNKMVLDIGGAKGEFCRILTNKKKCKAINLEPNPYDIEFNPCCENTDIWQNTHIGSADNIPFKDNWFDLVICRGVLEHINPDKHIKIMNEIYRVLKHNGIVYLLIPNWHCKNDNFELYKISYKNILKITTGFKLIQILDTHLRLHWIAKIPIIREKLIVSLVYILKK